MKKSFSLALSLEELKSEEEKFKGVRLNSIKRNFGFCSRRLEK